MRISARARSAWRGTALLALQPAGETAGGARAVVDDGLYERFGRPDVVLGQHVAPLLAGFLGLQPGPAFAAPDSLTVVLHGHPRHREIRRTLPDKADQARNRKKLGSRGGRPPHFDPVDHRERHAVECGVNRLKGAASWPQGTTSSRSATRRPSS
ncbi:hypothetical protein [Streptomyces altiplanensis]